VQQAQVQAAAYLWTQSQTLEQQALPTQATPVTHAAVGAHARTPQAHTPRHAQWAAGEKQRGGRVRDATVAAENERGGGRGAYAGLSSRCVCCFLLGCFHTRHVLCQIVVGRESSQVQVCF
jgi:hypothetical protein